MNEPIRYTGKTEGCPLGSPHWEHPKGEWVKWEDYVSLKDKNARLKTEVEHLMIFCNCTLIPNKELQKENARLKAEVERLRKAGDAMAHWVGEDTHFWWGQPEAAVEAWNAAKEGKPSV